MNQPKDANQYMITHTLPGTTAATAGNYEVFFIAIKKCVVKAISAVWSGESSSGTLQVQRIQATETSGNGDDLLSSTIDLSGTASTVNNGTLTSTVAYLKLAAGDRLLIEDGGTMTGQDDLTVTVLLEQVD